MRISDICCNAKMAIIVIGAVRILIMAIVLVVAEAR